VVVLAWPAIDTWLYKGRFADAAGLVMLSTFYFTVSGLVMAVGVAFQALGAFRPLALAELTGAVMTAIGMVALSVEFGYSWCLVGMMIGGLVQIFEMLRLLPLELRRGIAQSVLRRSRASLVG
jgi:O-antigen/teichoic acid export membrane protein